MAFARITPVGAALAAAILTLLLVSGAASEPAADTVAWRLGRSDFLHYERCRITAKDGAEKRGKADVVTVHGHDLRDRGQYRPATPRKVDLPALLGLRLPAAGQQRTDLKVDWVLHGTVNLRVKGRVEIVDAGPRIVRLRGSYDFTSRGKEKPGDVFDLSDGTASVELEFDKREGVVQHARVELIYKQRRVEAKTGERAKKLSESHDFVLKRIARARYPEFQKEIDAAIDKGVAHLRTLQEDDGTFKPHAKYALGTTALGVLTLLACDVPRTDPAVEKALAWIFEQEATKTYEQAVSLMAIDRAYTPKEELQRAQRGRVETFERDLPPERRAWVERVARRLEHGCASPGSWGYPPANARLLLRFDSSNTQYAVLGLRAAAHLGYEVSDKTWLGIVRHFRLVRERKAPRGFVSLVRRGEAVPDERYAHEINRVPVPAVAGFRYATLNSYARPWASMTCAAIASLTIARHQLRVAGSKKVNAKLDREIEEMVLGGWAWLDAHWGMDRHPEHKSNSWYYYYLYSLERAGILTNVKRVGGRDWYFEGAVQLLARQQEKGGWNNPGGDATPQTCFALLFLKRGTTPLSAPVTGR